MVIYNCRSKKKYCYLVASDVKNCWLTTAVCFYFGHCYLVTCCTEEMANPIHRRGDRRTVMSRDSVTVSMGQSPSCYGRFSPNEEIPRLLQKKEIHDRVHNSPQPVPILSHINHLHPTGYVIHQQFNIQ